MNFPSTSNHVRTFCTSRDSSTVPIGCEVRDKSKPLDLSQLLRTSVPSLFAPEATFKPANFLSSGTAQTLYSAAGPSTTTLVRYSRKCIMLPDGGNIALDFTPPQAFDSELDQTPIVIVLHGALGGSNAPYVHAALEPLTRSKCSGGSGLRAVVFNFRGCNGTRLTSPHLYHPRMTDDLRSIILYLRSLAPNAPLYALGFSMGASLLTTYLAEEGEDSAISAAFCVSNVFDYVGCTKELDSGSVLSRRVFSPAIGLGHRKIVAANKDAFVAASRQLEGCTDSTSRRKRDALSKVLWNPFLTMSSFTNDLVVPFTDYKDMSAFLEDTSCKSILKDVRVPLVCLNAEDDPLMKGDLLPLSEAEANPFVALAVTREGGHIGWYTWQSGRMTQWFAKPVCEYFEAMHKVGIRARPSPIALGVDVSGMRHQDGRLFVGFKEVSEAYIRSLKLDGASPTVSSPTKAVVRSAQQKHNFTVQMVQWLFSYLLIVLQKHSAMRLLV